MNAASSNTGTPPHADDGRITPAGAEGSEPAWRPAYGGTEKSLRQVLAESKAEWERVAPVAKACWAIEKQANWWARFQDWMLWRDLREEVMQCLRDHGLSSSQV